MKRLAGRLLHLFADGPWLACGAFLCVLACATLRRLGTPPVLSGWLLLATLVATLGISVRGFTRR